MQGMRAAPRSPVVTRSAFKRRWRQGAGEIRSLEFENLSQAVGIEGNNPAGLGAFVGETQGEESNGTLQLRVLMPRSALGYRGELLVP